MIIRIVLFFILILSACALASNTVVIPAWFDASGHPDCSAGIDVHYPLEVGAISGRPGMIATPAESQRQSWLKNLSA